MANSKSRNWLCLFCMNYTVFLGILFVLTLVGYRVEDSVLPYIQGFVSNDGQSSPQKFLRTYWYGCCLMSLFVPVAMEIARRVVSVYDPNETKALVSGDFWATTVLGTIESFLYPMALVNQNVEIIAAWLLLKAAGTWTRWTGDGGGNRDSCGSIHNRLETQNRARRRFNVFLIGNAICIGLSAIIAILLSDYLRPTHSTLQLRWSG